MSFVVKLFCKIHIRIFSLYCKLVKLCYLSKFDFPYQIVFVALATLWLLILINYENPFFIVNSINLCLGRGNIFFSSSYKKRKAEKLIIRSMVVVYRRVCIRPFERLKVTKTVMISLSNHQPWHVTPRPSIWVLSNACRKVAEASACSMVSQTFTR